MNLTAFIRIKFRIAAYLAAHNLVLRQQLAIMKRTNRRPRIKTTDRLFWVLLSRIWSPWCTSLIIVKPRNVVKWHRNGFKLFCEFKSKPKGLGRTHIHSEIRDLVRKMATANQNWGAPRIHGELLRLGLEVPERTVSNLMPRRHEIQDFPNHGDHFNINTNSTARWTAQQVVEAFPEDSVPKYLLRDRDSI